MLESYQFKFFGWHVDKESVKEKRYAPGSDPFDGEQIYCVSRGNPSFFLRNRKLLRNVPVTKRRSVQDASGAQNGFVRFVSHIQKTKKHEDWH